MSLINISSEGSGPHALFISQILACSSSLACCVTAGAPSGSPQLIPDRFPISNKWPDSSLSCSQTCRWSRTQKQTLCGECAALVIGVGSHPGRFIFVKSWNFSAFLSPPFTLDRRKIENWPTVVMLVPEFRPGQLNREQFNFLMSLKTEMPPISQRTTVGTRECSELGRLGSGRFLTPTRICWILLLV